jgi:hypothetical protein
MGIEYRVLGPLEVLVRGRSVDLGPPRHGGVLILLIVHAERRGPAASSDRRALARRSERLARTGTLALDDGHLEEVTHPITEEVA